MKNPISFFPTPNFIVKKMIELADINKKDTVLETGFGECAFISELYQKKFKNIIGIEYSNLFYQSAVEKFPSLKSDLYHNDFLEFKIDKKIKHIIGNPPYTNSDSLDIKVKENIRNITNSGEGNIYYAFIIKSIELLEEGGSLTYILPYDFFFNTFASFLREYMIKNGYFTDIIDLGEVKIFENASPEIIIFKYIKNRKINIKDKPCINVQKVKENINSKYYLENNWVNSFERFKIKQFHNSNIWSLSKIKEIEGIKLKDIKGIKVSVGIVNGAEKYFHIPKNQINKFSDNEKEKYIKPFIKNKHKPQNINDFSKGFEYYIWIPYNEFKTEKDLEEKAPNIYRHLLNFKENMINRKLSKSKQWFDYVAIRNLEVFEKQKNRLKIHVPSLTRLTKDWFFKSKNNFYVSGDLITISAENEELLKKIFIYLNSKEFVEYYKERGAKKGKRIVFTQKIVSEIVIPSNVNLF